MDSSSTPKIVFIIADTDSIGRISCDDLNKCSGFSSISSSPSTTIANGCDNDNNKKENIIKSHNEKTKESPPQNIIENHELLSFEQKNEEENTEQNGDDEDNNTDSCCDGDKNISNSDDNNNAVLQHQHLSSEMIVTAELEVQQLKKVFQKFDINNSGFLSKDNIYDGIISIGFQLSREEVDTLFMEAETDSNGNVSFNDLVKCLGFSSPRDCSSSSISTRDSDNINGFDTSHSHEESQREEQEQKVIPKKPHRLSKDNIHGSVKNLFRGFKTLVGNIIADDNDTNLKVEEEEESRDMHMKNVFEKFDIDNTGYLCKDNIFDFLLSSGLEYTREEADAVFIKADTDSKGRISCDDLNKCLGFSSSSTSSDCSGSGGGGNDTNNNKSITICHSDTSKNSSTQNIIEEHELSSSEQKVEEENKLKNDDSDDNNTISCFDGDSSGSNTESIEQKQEQSIPKKPHQLSKKTIHGSVKNLFNNFKTRIGNIIPDDNDEDADDTKDMNATRYIPQHQLLSSSEEKGKEEEKSRDMHMKNVFEKFDIDNTGYLCKDNIYDFLLSSGLEYTRDGADAVFVKADTDSKGRISCDDLNTYLGFSSFSVEIEEIENEEIKAKKVFQNLDIHNTGYISKENLYDGIMSLGFEATRDQVDALFMEADQDLDGLVSFDDLNKSLGLSPPPTSESDNIKTVRSSSNSEEIDKDDEEKVDEEMKAKKVFQKLDIDNTGYISKENLYDGIISLGFELTREQAQDLFIEADQDFDGLISFDDLDKTLRFSSTNNN